MKNLWADLSRMSGPGFAKTTNDLSRLGRAALRYAERGWRVFPVRPGAKEPQIAQWQLAATTGLEQVRRWWLQWPGANIALVTGQQSGIVVLDVDPRHGGFDSWHDLLDVCGPVDTLEAYTGGGGSHIYFTAPGEKLRNSAGAIGPGIDTRAEGGYVLLPPSIHPSRERYEWTTRLPPCEVPPWLLNRWHRQQDRPSTRMSAAGETVETSAAWRLLQGPIEEGKRNSALTSLAGWVRQYHPEHVVEAMLQAWNLGLCLPPLDRDEVTSITRSVYKYPQRGINGHPRAVVPSFFREVDNP